MGSLLCKLFKRSPTQEEDSSVELASFDATAEFRKGQDIADVIDRVMHAHEKHKMVSVYLDLEAVGRWGDTIPEQNYRNGDFLYSEVSENILRKGRDFYFMTK